MPGHTPKEKAKKRKNPNTKGLMNKEKKTKKRSKRGSGHTFE